MITLTHVYKEFPLDGEVFTALSDITITIEEGEFVSIVGPSGCGKSTLMYIMGLLDRPTRGSVVLNGKDVSKLSDNTLSDLRNKFVGFIFQQFNLINKLTVSENILLPALYTKEPLAFNPRQKADELIEQLGITRIKDSFPNKISGGQQQRVAIARALMMNPEIILADEPTGNLDSKNGAAILALIAQLNKQYQTTIVIITHDAEIAKKAKRTIRIVDGAIIRN